MGKDVIIACDFAGKKEVLDFLDKFTGRKPFVKIGMELFYAEGPEIVREIKARGHKIFLDLKLHDIPNTVKKAMSVLSRLDVDMSKELILESGVKGYLIPDGHLTAKGFGDVTIYAVLSKTDYNGNVETIGGSIIYRKTSVKLVINTVISNAELSVVDYIESVKHGINPYFTTNTLTYLARGGRVTKIASVFGNVLSIKPILRLDYAGHLLVHTKGHGKSNTYKKLLEAIKEQVINPESQTLYVSHSNAIESAVEFAEMVKKELGFKDIFYSYIGSIIGSHTGPGLIAVFFHGKDRFE